MMEYHKSISFLRTFILSFVYLALSVKETQSYSSGAPLDACTTLTPGHGYTPQTSTSPFTITPQFRNYGPSTQMQVNLTTTSGISFKGFMVQARVVGTSTPVGIFSDTSSVGQRINCPGGFANTLTHINNDPKTLVSAMWTGPSDINGADIEFVGTFVNQRAIYWTFVRSFTLTDACMPSPCQNDGTCFRAGTEGYHCNCAGGFTGKDCSDQAPCADEVLTCGVNHKQCLLSGANENSFVCVCLDGTFSVNAPCDGSTMAPPTTLLPTTLLPTTEMDPCRTGPCQNGGVCIKEDASSYTCECRTIYTGPQCQYTVGCASIPCQNNGVCTSTGIYGQGYACDCSTMYSGTDCEIEVDPCLSQPCMNGGYCSRRGDMTGYVCTCYDGYTGNRCETPPPPTTMPPPTTPSQPTTQPPTTTPPQPTTPPPPQTTPPVVTTTLGSGECSQSCLNDGSCVDGSCVCITGFSGPRCEQDGRPFFTNCPEDETLTFVLDEGTNVASVDLDPITARNFNQETLDVVFIVGPDLNTVTSLEFSEAYAEGQVVVAQAQDQNGRRNCSFVIRLQDNQTPEITCPEDIVEISTSSSQQITWPDAEVEDNADPSPVVTYIPTQGSMFDTTGETVSIIARATDTSSNYKECIFRVTVHMRDFDCDPFLTVENAEVSCDNDANGRECHVLCNTGFVKTVANDIRYTCIADSEASFWDPSPRSICAEAETGNGITKTTSISFPLQSASCPQETPNFTSSIATNITSTLDTFNLCSVGPASACGEGSVSTACTTNTARRRRSSEVILSRRRRDNSVLLVDISVYSPVDSNSDRGEIEEDIDQVTDGIVDVANNEGFELTVNGEVVNNVQSGTRVPQEFQWSCDSGMVSSSSGCVPCQPGTYYDESKNVCSFCSSGTYQDQTKQTSCQQCPGDSFTDATGSVLADCFDPSAFQLTQTQWILVYIGCSLAGAFILLILVTFIICCCRSKEETPRKGKDATDHLTYLNSAFEDDAINNDMHYTNTLTRNGSTLPMNGHRSNGNGPRGGDNRLIEIPSDPEVLYAEVPVTSFNAKGYNDFNSRLSTNGRANGHVNSVSATIDMDTIPRPPTLGAPPPPPPPPPAEDKPKRILTEDELPPPPPNNHHFNGMPGDSAPSGPPPPPPKVPGGPTHSPQLRGGPPPPPPKLPGGPPPPPNVPGGVPGGVPPPPPPPPLPSMNSNNNSYTSSPSGSTTSGRSDRRARFLL
ncbi:sushi, von Willebrand factor type A, EGF and pentraxin domain-containing protein 1 isoform X2 [Strongylocentrotus purpuratus]|uniref:Uncharacterized protein n=1 Tax=Strongylocentrotus purpuratus TaxID=7668 RepID=A0A7M7N6Y6_STRPU|nr:sushi, von Willebrand factor type A, EGF and pentraxin domain-containing protein 1 isoform X2 [Strongylocentrotus purpuratus]